MKIDRLIGILSILLQKDTVTAPDLAEKFEVSRRTINRDIERRIRPVHRAVLSDFSMVKLVCVGLLQNAGGFPAVQAKPHGGCARVGGGVCKEESRCAGFK